MDKVLLSLLVVAAGTQVWSNSTRTAKLEILRSPTKVAIWKPDPYPVLLKTYGDEVPAPAVNNRTVPPADTGPEENKTLSENEISADDNVHNYTEVNNSTLLEAVAKNVTCVRRDYEDDVAAVFKDETGAIQTAELVFNSTVQLPEGRISNVTELTGLQVLNETLVDCGVYFNMTT